jgi:hypothetical protein
MSVHLTDSEIAEAKEKAHDLVRTGMQSAILHLVKSGCPVDLSPLVVVDVVKQEMLAMLTAFREKVEGEAESSPGTAH